MLLLLREPSTPLRPVSTSCGMCRITPPMNALAARCTTPLPPRNAQTMRSASLGPYALLRTSTSTYGMSFVNNMMTHRIEGETNLLARACATLDDTMRSFLPLSNHLHGVLRNIRLELLQLCHYDSDGICIHAIFPRYHSVLLFVFLRSHHHRWSGRQALLLTLACLAAFHHALRVVINHDITRTFNAAHMQCPVGMARLA